MVRAIEAEVRAECEAERAVQPTAIEYVGNCDCGRQVRLIAPAVPLTLFTEADARDAARLDWVLSTLSRRRFQCDIGIRDRIHDGSLQMTRPIPISAARLIAESYDYDQVVIIARKVGDREHVTTYGKSKEHCEIAAKIGDFIKFKIMKWEPADD